MSCSPLEFIHQCGFSNSGFTCHKDDLPLSGHRSPQAIVQFIQCPVPSGQPHTSRGSGIGSLALLDRSNKLVPTPGQRLKEHWCFRIVAKYFSQIEDVAFQHLGLHVRIPPNLIQKLVLRDDAPGVLNQMA